METWECARCGAEVEDTAEHPEIGCDIQSLPMSVVSSIIRTSKEMENKMEDWKIQLAEIKQQLINEHFDKIIKKGKN